MITIRLLQGVAVGGEWGGATTMIIEYAPEGRRGLFGTFVQLGNVTGLLTSTGAFALASSMNETAFMTWGWRVPFLVSVVLLGSACSFGSGCRSLRFPASARGKEERGVAGSEGPAAYPKQIVIVFAMRLSETVLGFLIMGWLLSYTTTGLGLPRSVGLTGLILATASGVITFPIFGWLSDIWGRRPVYLFGCVGACVFAFPMIWMINTGTAIGIDLAMIIGYGTVLAAQYTLDRYSLNCSTPTSATRACRWGRNWRPSPVGSLRRSPPSSFWGGGATWPVALFLPSLRRLRPWAVLAAGETFKRDVIQQRQDNSLMQDPKLRAVLQNLFGKRQSLI